MLTRYPLGTFYFVSAMQYCNKTITPSKFHCSRLQNIYSFSAHPVHSEKERNRGLRLSPPSRKSLYGFPTASTEQPHRQQHHDRQEATIMPFGKHEDRSLRFIFDTDRKYLVWCLNQPWFRTKCGKSFDIIVEIVHRAGERW